MARLHISWLARGSALFVAIAAALGLGGLGCSNPAPTSTPASFDRPDTIALFCWDLTEDVPTALERCAPETPATIEEDIGEPPDGFALHAFVSQTSSGEIAAVRISGRNGEAGVIDGDVRIPGFTFAAVGEVPSGLATSSRDPKHVYVVSRGSGLLQSLATADFRKGLGTAVVGEVALPLGSRPNALVLAPDESALFMALPETGQIASVALNGDGTFGAVTLVDLSVDVPAPVDLSALPADQLPPQYRYTCQTSSIFEPPILPPRAPVSTGGTPEPWELLLDPESGLLYVADRALPIIHVLDPATLTEQAPLSVSVPTRELALTPRVPATLDDTEPTERFLYAIDATDRTVLAVDLTDPARGSYGAVIPVEVSYPYDRLNAPLPARALAVVSPTYTDEAPAVIDCGTAAAGQTANGINLHGVFLTVGTVDGRIRFFDIFDRDASCRGVSCASQGTPEGEDEVVAIGRHRPRLGGFLQDPVSVTPDPSWDSDTVGVVAVNPDGSSRSPEAVPSLTEVTCDSPLDVVFPVDGGSGPRICAVRDPWAAVSERFVVSYEGQIPFSGTSGANFDEALPYLEIRGDPCSLGVLGSMDVPADGYLSEYAGDLVAITGDLPPSILNGTDEDLLDRCQELTQRTVSGAVTPILLPIVHAWTRPDGIRDTYAGRLEVGDPIRLDGGFTLDDVRRCYPELLEIEIRAREAFVVESSRQGFLHPVRRAVDGQCSVDPVLADELRRGRAFFGETYRSPYMIFALGEAPVALGRPTLDFTIGQVPVPLTIDSSSVGGSDRSSLLTRLTYSPVDERLYAVDQSAQGLLRIRLTNLTVQQTFR